MESDPWTLLRFELLKAMCITASDRCTSSRALLHNLPQATRIEVGFAKSPLISLRLTALNTSFSTLQEHYFSTLLPDSLQVRVLASVTGPQVDFVELEILSPWSLDHETSAKSIVERVGVHTTIVRCRTEVETSAPLPGEDVKDRALKLYLLSREDDHSAQALGDRDLLGGLLALC